MKNRQLTSEELSALATFCNRGYEDQPLWSEIEPGLWMGGTADDDVTEYGHRRPAITNEHFDTVVTLYAQANPVDWYVKEVRLGFFDHSEVDLDHHDLAQAVLAAHQDWMRGKRVLIRCQAGCQCFHARLAYCNKLSCGHCCPWQSPAIGAWPSHLSPSIHVSAN